MPSYPLMYRLGMTPWERYGQGAAASVAAVLDRERAEADEPPGRALDLGCGRAQFTPELVRRGWSAVGLDIVPEVIEGARRNDPDGGTYVVGASPRSIRSWDSSTCSWTSGASRGSRLRIGPRWAAASPSGLRPVPGS